MIVVDSTVWIDWFRAIPASRVDLLDHLLIEDEVLMGDLILLELLQGFPAGRRLREAQRLLEDLPFAPMVGRDIALLAADHHRHLRGLGITIRRTIDLLIGTFCILNDHALLQNDRDFLPMARHLGLRLVPTEAA